MNKTHVTVANLAGMALALTPFAFIALTRTNALIDFIVIGLWFVCCWGVTFNALMHLGSGQSQGLWSRQVFPMPLWIRAAVALAALIAIALMLFR